MPRDGASKESVLGVFVDRSVTMACAKPRFINKVSEDAEEAVELLVCALQDRPGEVWSRASLVVDAGGPWWCKPLDEFLSLNAKDRAWVVRNLKPTVAGAATELERLAQEREWLQAWGQPLLPQFTKKFSSTRPDLIGFRGGHVDVIDIKTTGRRPDSYTISQDMPDRFGEWEHRLHLLEARHVASFVVVVQVGTGQAATFRLTDDDSWEDYPWPTQSSGQRQPA